VTGHHVTIRQPHATPGPHHQQAISQQTGTWGSQPSFFENLFLSYCMLILFDCSTVGITWLQVYPWILPGRSMEKPVSISTHGSRSLILVDPWGSKYFTHRYLWQVLYQAFAMAMVTDLEAVTFHATFMLSWYIDLVVMGGCCFCLTSHLSMVVPQVPLPWL